MVELNRLEAGNKENFSMSFSFIFLGSGTSQGVPLIGKEYPPEFLANPKTTAPGPPFTLPRTNQTGRGHDAGVPHPDAARKLRWLDAVIFTHSHADHIMGLDDCRRFCDLRDGPLPVYANEETMAALKRVFIYAFDGRPIWKGYFHPEPHVIDGPFTWAIWKSFPCPAAWPLMTNGYLFLQNGQNGWRI